METNRKLRVKIQKGDLAVAIEGSEDYIKNFLGEDTVKKLGEVVRSELEKSKASVAVPETAQISPPTSAIDNYERTVVGRIKYLTDTGFFDNPRSIRETVEELARIGFPYDSKSIDNALRSLLRRSGLRRLGIRGEYLYVHP
jgi:hypothetical protein